MVLGSKKVSACDPKACRFMKLLLRDYSTMNFDMSVALADSIHPNLTTLSLTQETWAIPWSCYSLQFRLHELPGSSVTTG